MGQAEKESGKKKKKGGRKTLKLSKACATEGDLRPLTSGDSLGEDLPPSESFFYFYFFEICFKIKLPPLIYASVIQSRVWLWQKGRFLSDHDFISHWLSTQPWCNTWTPKTDTRPWLCSRFVGAQASASPGREQHISLLWLLLLLLIPVAAKSWSWFLIKKRLNCVFILIIEPWKDTLLHLWRVMRYKASVTTSPQREMRNQKGHFSAIFAVRI